MKNILTLKSGFRIIQIDDFVDFRKEKQVMISCHELPDDDDPKEYTASYYLTKDEILLMIEKLKESVLYLENQPE